MKKLLFLVATICCCFCLLTRCKKSDNKTVVTNPPTDTLAAFAQSLAASCTHSFAGAGDTTTFYLPTAFTPNGDGYNDKFILSGKGLGLVTHMVVFNRWGQVMYEAFNIPPNDFSYGWDGTFQGQVLPPDVYMYVVEVACETQGGTFKFHGDISLVR